MLCQAHDQKVITHKSPISAIWLPPNPMDCVSDRRISIRAGLIAYPASHPEVMVISSLSARRSNRSGRRPMRMARRSVCSCSASNVPAGWSFEPTPESVCSSGGSVRRVPGSIWTTHPLDRITGGNDLPTPRKGRNSASLDARRSSHDRLHSGGIVFAGATAFDAF